MSTDDFKAKQKGILQSMVAATVVFVIYLVGVDFLGRVIDLHQLALGRGHLALLACTFGILPLWLGVAIVARQRFFSVRAIDGADVSEKLTINLHYIRNTQEQSLFFMVAIVGLCFTLPAQILFYIPALTLWYIFARLCFLIGYHRNATARAFGFFATFMPNTLMLLLVCILLVRYFY